MNRLDAWALRLLLRLAVWMFAPEPVASPPHPALVEMRRLRLAKDLAEVDGVLWQALGRSAPERSYRH